MFTDQQLHAILLLQLRLNGIHHTSNISIAKSMAKLTSQILKASKWCHWVYITTVFNTVLLCKSPCDSMGVGDINVIYNDSKYLSITNDIYIYRCNLNDIKIIIT